MKSPLPIILFLFSVVFGGVFILEPWIDIVAQKNPLQPRILFGQPQLTDKEYNGLPPLPPVGEDYQLSARFWQSGANFPGACAYSSVTAYQSPAVQINFKTYQYGGRAIFGALVVCWAIFVFRFRRDLARLSLRAWMVIAIIIFGAGFLALVIYLGPARGCDTFYGMYIRFVFLNWPMLIFSLLGVGSGVAAILTSRRNADKGLL